MCDPSSKSLLSDIRPPANVAGRMTYDVIERSRTRARNDVVAFSRSASLGRRYHDSRFSCPSTPKLLRARTTNAQPVRTSRPHSEPAGLRHPETPDLCLSAPPPSRSDSRCFRRHHDANGTLLPPNIRFDPVVVGEVGPDSSRVPKESVQVQQLRKIQDEQVIDELMASIQIRPISNEVKVKPTSCVGDKRLKRDTLAKGRTWPCIRFSSASKNSSRTTTRAGWMRSNGNLKVEGRSESMGGIDLQDEEESMIGDDTCEGICEPESTLTFSAEKVVLSPKPNKSSRGSGSNGQMRAQQTRTYELRKSGRIRTPLPVSKIGLLEKRARGSILRQSRSQSVTPYLPDYRSSELRGELHDQRPFSSQESSSVKKVTFSDKRAASSEATRPRYEVGEIDNRKLRLPSSGRRKHEVKRLNSPMRERRTSGKSRYERPQGTLYAKISVADLDMPQPTSGTSWLRAYQRKELIFYTAILRDEDKYIKALSSMSDLEGVSVKTLSVGSLVVQLQCRTSSDVARLEKLYRRKTLASLFNKVLVNDDLMEEMGVQNMILEVNIEKADFERCKRELMIKEMDDGMAFETGINMEKKDSDDRFMSRTDCISGLESVLEDFQGQMRTLRIRHESIAHNQKEFLMTLKLAKPVHIKHFRSLSDVIIVHRYLRGSPSVGKSVKTDLVTDFLSIINLARLKLGELITKIKAIERNVIKYVDSAMLDKIYKVVGEVSSVLDPSFSLRDVINDRTIFLGIMDSKIFGNLVYYVPHLFNRLNDVRVVIKQLIKSLTLTHQSDIKENGDSGNPDAPISEESSEVGISDGTETSMVCCAEEQQPDTGGINSTAAGAPPRDIVHIPS